MTWSSVVFLALLMGGFFVGWRAVKPFLERHTKIAETKADAVKPEPPPVPAKHASMPASIAMLAHDWIDPWAREQTMEYYLELYEQSKDWNVVQSIALADQARLLRAKGELS